MADSLSAGLSSGVIIRPTGMVSPSLSQAATSGAIVPSSAGGNISGLGYAKQSVAVNPTDNRLATTGLSVGGNPKGVPGVAGDLPAAIAAAAPSKINVSDSTKLAAAESAMGAAVDQAVEEDWRVRMSCAPSAPYLYKDGSNYLMAPLIPTGGVIFPYTPRITISHTANYETHAPTHSNYPIHSYKNSAVTSITISGDFTAQTQKEADYVLATILFFRSATKMFWGKDPLGGNPPPVLYLDGYGTHYFPHVPVVVKSFVNDVGEETDFIEGYVSKTRVPSFSVMSITVEPVYSRKKIHEEFTFEKYSRGTLSTISSGGFI